MRSEDRRPGTALVPIAPAQTCDALTRPGTRAVFLAHLIATRRQEPQTRVRRRAEPDEATRAYRRGDARPVPGPVLSRTL
ncbi:MAG TPA: hypothetical protein VEK73_05765 [Xanthobacteraceae bacterium]|nr:hypothetical protein [Xanthobacteraceae bacterium]